MRQFIYLFIYLSAYLIKWSLKHYSINLYVIKSTFQKRIEVQKLPCFYNEYKIFLIMVLKVLMVHTKSKIDLMPVAMTIIAPLYHKCPLKHHKSF